MSRFLIHIHSGPEAANTVTLGALVAATAAGDGHEVTVFFAGDGVHNFAPETRAALEGQGTGRLAEHLDAIANSGGRFVLSGMSAKARGYDNAILKDMPAEFATPSVLVALADTADTVLCY